ncbi:hypothetical protein HMPREF9413_2119 [Paenibacillus sp. HGF7]|nr:hypothetical protein HMPREF9413_2119 [Paenibacillus sp. HGF7]
MLSGGTKGYGARPAQEGCVYLVREGSAGDYTVSLSKQERSEMD